MGVNTFGFYKTIKAARQMDVSVVDACNMRIKYLYETIGRLRLSIDDSLNEITRCFMDSQINKLNDEIKYLHNKRSMAEKPVQEGQITDDDIQDAKDVPIESVVDFDRYGKAIAFCHEDTNPSLSWNRKINRARCFVCNKNFDTIAVLMERDHMSFRSAVLSLTR